MVANRESGSLSLVDLATSRVIAEQVVGRRLSDLVSLGGRQYLASDEGAHELLLVDVVSETVTVRVEEPGHHRPAGHFEVEDSPVTGERVRLLEIDEVVAELEPLLAEARDCESRHLLA